MFHIYFNHKLYMIYKVVNIANSSTPLYIIYRCLANILVYIYNTCLTIRTNMCQLHDYGWSILSPVSCKYMQTYIFSQFQNYVM